MFFLIRLISMLFLMMISWEWLIGCATTRTYGTTSAIDENALSQIYSGISTTADLRRLLGEPTEIETPASNQEIWIYRYIEYRGTNLPLFGPITTGEGREGIVKFEINNGRVERSERTQTRRSAGL